METAYKISSSFIIFLLVLLSLNATNLAQEQRPADAPVITIWPEGKIPLQQELDKPEYWERWGMFNVTKPTLTIYPASPDKADGTAMLILPGGGYSCVCMNHEGHKVGQWLSQHGISAFVLKYRCKPFKHPVPLLDAQRALRLIRHDAAKYHINPNRIGVMGFSAGGHLAATLSTIGTQTFNPPIDEIDKLSARLNYSVLVYPVITLTQDFAYRGAITNLLKSASDTQTATLLSPELQVTDNTPPAILVHGDQDKGVIVKNSELYRDALLARKIPAKLILVEGAGHGFGLRDAWANECLTWIHQTLSAK